MINIGMIPARFHSTRFPGKPLADLLGKPLIIHTWERASQAACLDAIFIATDDVRIKNVAEQYGARVIMTSPEALSGTDRIAEAAGQLAADFITNIQGDEPLITPGMIENVAKALEKADDCETATLKTALRSEEELLDPHTVKVVTDHRNRALYFSRLPIPFSPDFSFDAGAHPAPGERKRSLEGYYKHIGIYCYRKNFLMRFTRMKPTFLEQTERLEQLRILENGYPIAVAETHGQSVGVDTPGDLEKLIALLHERETG